MSYLPVVFWCGGVFVLGLVVGSFLNVLIARLPYEKSIVWPSSRCFSCFRPIRALDNIPILGYLRLRGRCRHCCVAFSRRYLWVEIGTGLAFLALFVLEVPLNWHGIPALKFDPLAGNSALPPGPALVMFAYHAFLLSALIAAAVIDAEHRIIPPLIPYTGMVVGIVGGALMPWPWPNPPESGTLTHPGLIPGASWMLSEFWGKIPLGVQPWPFWGPTFKFAPPGSMQLGLLTGLIGALAGSLVVRLVRWLFGTGFGREPMGMGDADLLMMAGAFLGWQVAVTSLFVAAPVALLLWLAQKLFSAKADAATADGRELPFGPGLALGIVATWFAWPWLGPQVQFVFFDLTIFGLSAFIMCVGLLAAGLLLRRSEAAPTAEMKV
jgi:leader peptidase (prepilin peptidase)/N-methyltransferase